MNLSKSKKLKLIEASYHTTSCSKNDDSETGILKLMTQRFNDSKRSFCALYAIKYTFDAMLIAGYMLELLAQITRIREHKIKAQEIYGKAVYQKIQMMLTLPPRDNKTQWDNFFYRWVEILERYASDVFWDKEIILSILKDKSLSRIQKLKRLHKEKNIFRHPTNIQKDIKHFISHAKKVLSSQKIDVDGLEEILNIMYQIYCCHKHSNLLPLIESEIDLASFVSVLSMVEYYDYFGKLDQLQKCYAVLS